jgi:ABC-type Mn2+/Zn2+ transport system permease subunit
VEWLLEPFGFDFMRNALIAGLLTVVTTSLVGTWVVLRGMAFLGDALAHGVIPGITAAFLLGVDLWIGAVVAAVVMLGGIDVINRRTRLSQDTSIGLLFVGMLAAGVMLISARGAYAGDLTAILFGDVIGVSAADVGVALGAAVATVIVSVLLYRAFLVLSFSHDKAALLRLRPRWTHLAMLALIALAIVSSFRTVGTLLVFAFIIAPPATAALVARRVPAMMGVAVIVGWVAVIVGLLLSFHIGVAGAPTIAFVSVVEFFIVLTVREWRAGRTDTAGSAAQPA